MSMNSQPQQSDLFPRGVAEATILAAATAGTMVEGGFNGDGSPNNGLQFADGFQTVGETAVTGVGAAIAMAGVRWAFGRGHFSKLAMQVLAPVGAFLGGAIEAAQDYEGYDAPSRISEWAIRLGYIASRGATAAATAAVVTNAMLRDK
jgi:hypothetical protein